MKNSKLLHIKNFLTPHHHHHGAECDHHENDKAQSQASLKRVALAFVLNLGFAVFELIVGLSIQSWSVVSDAIHDFGDAMALGMSYFLEKKSQQGSTEHYTYGYRRFSVISAALTSLILLAGSIVVAVFSVRSIYLQEFLVQEKPMVLIALFGILINGVAAKTLSQGSSLHEKAISLHFWQDLVGWIAVLFAGVAIYFTQWHWLDVALALVLSLWFGYAAWNSFSNAIVVLLQKVPEGLSVAKIQGELLENFKIQSVENLKVWSLDGERHVLTMKMTALGESTDISAIKKFLRDQYKITDATIEVLPAK